MVIMKNDFTEKIASFFRDCLMIIKTSLEEIKNRLEKKTIDYNTPHNLDSVLRWIQI